MYLHLSLLLKRVKVRQFHRFTFACRPPRLHPVPRLHPARLHSARCLLHCSHTQPPMADPIALPRRSLPLPSPPLPASHVPSPPLPTTLHIPSPAAAGSRGRYDGAPRGAAADLPKARRRSIPPRRTRPPHPLSAAPASTNTRYSSPLPVCPVANLTPFD
jgi:hypothetical protein